MKNRVNDNSIDLIVTSPPYWNVKDYGIDDQIGFDQSLDDYLDSMNKVLKECYRVLKEGRRMIINIRDIPVTSSVKGEANRGNFYAIPLGAHIACEVLKSARFFNVGTIYWYKIGTCNAQCTNNAGILGSYPYPPNAHIAFRIEYIFIFRKKDDVSSRPDKKMLVEKEKSRLTKEEWKEYTNQLWNFPGSHVEGHPATFPLELPRRCIKLWSFAGETILEPFLGTGTTLQACQHLNRNGIGFEICTKYEKIINARLSKALTPEFIAFHTTKQNKVI